MKKVLVIKTSPRRNGNSNRLADSFVKGAVEAGHQVETASVSEMNLHFCRGCLACMKLGHCVIDDDANALTARMREADVIVWATPVYYFSCSGQMKTMIDRANALFNQECRFSDVYLLAAAADEGQEVVKGTETVVQGWVACFKQARHAGTVFADGVTKPGEIEGHKALSEAYELGKSLK